MQDFDLHAFLEALPYPVGLALVAFLLDVLVATQWVVADIVCVCVDYLYLAHRS
jgi:hypothetical protein